MAGVDLRDDESLSAGWGFYSFAEIERRATWGAEVRYGYWWTPTVGFHIGMIGVIAPYTMVGPSAGARFGFPIGKKLTFFLEPGLAVFPVGSDIPGNNIIIWGIFNGGIGVEL